MTKNVYLIGGPPGAGKTTLGAALALRLGITSLTIDDLVTAVQAVTTPESHPGLHLMWQISAVDYFTHTPPEQLIEDAQRQHETAWPFIERVIRKHANGGSRIVIDGWHLWAERVNALGLDSVWAGWLYVDPEVLRAREEQLDFYQSEAMLENFMACSLWFNETMKAEATKLGFPVLMQDGSKSADELCSEILAG
jgi:2-phosphoglycerate kinase